MTVEEKVQAVLIANAGVTALVPSSRIKSPGEWQDLACPYIIHFAVSGEPVQLHEGLSGFRMWPTYQVSCFGATHSQARAVANAVKTALADYADADAQIHLSRPPINVGAEPDSSVQHVVCEFQITGVLN